MNFRSNAKFALSVGVGAFFSGIAWLTWRKKRNIRAVPKGEDKNSNNTNNSNSNSNTVEGRRHSRRRSSLVNNDVIRVNTPYGIGVVDDQDIRKFKAAEKDSIVTVHLPNKTIGHLNRSDIKELSPDDPIFVRTPFGLGELIGAKQDGADFEPDEENGNAFKVKFPWSIAYLNAESLRIANPDPYPQVFCEPFGLGQIVEPAQTSFKITPKTNQQVVVKFEWGATGYMNPDCVSLLDRGFTLEK